MQHKKARDDLAFCLEKGRQVLSAIQAGENMLRETLRAFDPSGDPKPKKVSLSLIAAFEQETWPDKEEILGLLKEIQTLSDTVEDTSRRMDDILK